jgi:hypothetical protein
LYSSVSDETLDQIAFILGGEEGVVIMNAVKEVEEITVEEIAEETEGTRRRGGSSSSGGCSRS